MGLQSRLHIVYRDSYPQINAKNIAIKLAQAYITLGHPHKAIYAVLHKVQRNYKQVPEVADLPLKKQKITVLSLSH